MTIFDLLLIAVFLSTCLALLVSLIQAVKGRFLQAGKTLLATAGCLAIYLGAVCLVSLFRSEGTEPGRAGLQRRLVYYACVRAPTG